MSASSAEIVVSDQPLWPFERFFRSGSAAGVLANGWVLGTRAPVPLQAPVDWSYPGDQARSWNYHLHALDLIDPLLAEHSRSGDAECLRRALEIAGDWVARHPSPETPGQSPMAWYDMAVGLRAYRLGYLYDAARREGLDGLSDLAQSLWVHLDLLRREDFYTAHSNHGFYQLCGLLALARRFAPAEAAIEARGIGLARLAAMLDRQFTREGVHKEHSPDYHRAVLTSLQALRDSGLVDDPEISARIAVAETALDWFVRPNGRLANFGDSDNKAYGGAHPMGCRAFPESGYAVVRAPGGFLAQTLAFHSRTHKQADDLSFVWCEAGRDLLVDAGRFGYRGKTRQGDPLWEDGFWYADPKRVFVESTHAHNTVEIDGRSYPRKGVTPYGSALVWAGEAGSGLYVSEGRAVHGLVGHHRLLVYRPGAWLLVLDRMTPSDRRAHRYAQWFHFAPDLAVEPTGPGAVCASDDALTLHAASLADARLSGPYVGAESPRLQGWWSPAEGVFEPAPAVGFEQERAGPAVFATVLSLTGAVQPLAAEIGAGDGVGRLRWSCQAGEHTVELGREAGRVSVRYEERGTA
ncbi:heparinase II/III family protein [Caulobacter sp. 17J80-11]|uniref:heparinase II/III domain-containing protein n=1 Tax=Caulobacter sp. 17J80-11 TaxID=2763502 RepID=UPI0016538427|nr:heparinase II/III family protein [Caulobacter sp. 17J80-11]MBC6981684.1 heparinase II/III family protein [Caulobacter sp. 17J80-11]